MRSYNMNLTMIGAAAAALLMLQSPVAATTQSEPAQPAQVATELPAVPPQVAEPPVATSKPKPLPPTLVARIDLKSQTMTVQAAGKLVHTWKVSSGAPGYATPPGTFKPGWMARMWNSRQYDDAPMPHSVFFNQGIAVHATTSIGNLGRAASHGCVRLSPANAEKFYDLVTRHGMARTRIVVTGPQPFSAATDRIARLNREFSEQRRATQIAGGRASGNRMGSRTGNEWIVTPQRATTGARLPVGTNAGWTLRNGMAPSAAPQPRARTASRAAAVQRARF